VTVICVEFAQPAPVNRVEDTVAALGRHGYTAIARSAPALELEDDIQPSVKVTACPHSCRS